MERTCEQCAGPIRITRARVARFCSNACRQKSYRMRKSSGLPAAMTARPRWVRHDANKVPLTLFNGPASVVDSRTWSTYEKASRSTVGTGLGIVLGDGLGCIDLDNCLDGRKLAPWAREVVDEWRDRAIYTEVSMSGRGLHIFASMPEARGRRIRDGRNIEIYSRERYVAVTGRKFV